MRILVFTQGPYGERIFRHIKEKSPSGWTVESVELPRALPPLIDDPEEFIAQDLPETDLIVFLSESPQAPQLIPDVAVMTKAKAVIAPIDNSSWMPMGLKNQIQRDLTSRGIASAFPKTFCTLTENSCGYRSSAETYESEEIAAFARHFGRPKLKITVNPETRIIESVEVERGAPCGSTHHAAAGLVGLSADEAVPKAGLICHHYPCLASMQQEQIDKALFDTLMHLSGYVVNEEVEEQVKPFRTPVQYMDPRGD
ncbi:DUF166 domain-containing protein [Chloroflexota bacterium]